MTDSLAHSFITYFISQSLGDWVTLSVTSAVTPYGLIEWLWVIVSTEYSVTHSLGQWVTHESRHWVELSVAYARPALGIVANYKPALDEISSVREFIIS